ncbi:hypothetical protein ACFWTE_05710 [Nocardiopsis sp. NPDC058631]|uniref:hypothetical protein n=1 Tax=Nocardiopsis sp. NPDC058631 TaxID=3346566 RepID=UPI00365399F5
MALVPGVLYPLVGPWALLWAPVVLLCLVALLPRSGGGDTAPGEPDRSEPEPGPVRGPAGDPGTRIRPVALASAVDDHDLYFSATVHWRWSGHVDLRLRNPVAPAVLAVVTRASELARTTDPAREGMAECELAARLAVETAVLGSGVVAWAEDVSLRLADEDSERLRRLSSLRKDGALREAVREAEEELDEAAAVAPLPSPDLYPFGELDPADAPFGDGGPVPGGAAVPRVDADGPPPPAGPGNDVDSEGFESYWWPAETEGHDEAERDVQVAIIRGLIDDIEDDSARAEFAREQVRVLGLGGFDDVADRVRQACPELSGDPEQGTDHVPGGGFPPAAAG